MNNLLQELRDATRPFHRELDRLVSDPGFSRTSYGDYLLRFHEGLTASWPMLDWERLRHMSLPDAGRRKQRYHALAGDLARLGIPHSPLVDGQRKEDATAVGCLYVLEGSIHGGQVLLGRLKDADEIPEDSLRFLEGFGDENGSMWAAFTQWLTHLEASSGFVAGASEGATRTFNHFISSFSRN
jgi:heme oxygenase